MPRVTFSSLTCASTVDAHIKRVGWSRRNQPEPSRPPRPTILTSGHRQQASLCRAHVILSTERSGHYFEYALGNQDQLVKSQYLDAMQVSVEAT
jgi:hypothetical protein